MPSSVITVEGLSKEYSLGHSQSYSSTLYELLASKLRISSGDVKNGKADSQKFLALTDVGFEVKGGEVVGIIGRNGAGKSTLLKILSRITAPTTGRVVVRGRLSSLLEVGTGFHAELTGRENVYLNGAILGMPRKEINRKFDEIVAFAEVEKFIDTPVKRYSSGMYVRLAFGVAAHLDADILVIDEVLAVGDSSFQDKCMAKMGDLSTGGRTVIFVSHNHSAIARLCSRGVVLDAGHLAYDGKVNDALVEYGRRLLASGAAKSASTYGPLVGRVVFESVQWNASLAQEDRVIEPTEELEITIQGKLLVDVAGFRVSVSLFKRGELVVALHDLQRPRDCAAGWFESVVKLPALFLSPGEYSADIAAYSSRNSDWILGKNIGNFVIANHWAENYETNHSMGQVNYPHYGIRREWC